MDRQKIGIGSDHAGFQYKNTLHEFLKHAGYEVVDLGTYSEAAFDYPDIAKTVGTELVEGRIGRGILVCGSGVGVCIAVNKIPGIRAGMCHDGYSAHQGVEHDAMNTLCIGARIIGIELAKEIVLSFLGAVFSGEERHQRRLNKVLDIEKTFLKESKD